MEKQHGETTSTKLNKYKSKIETNNLDNGNITRFPLHVSFHGVNRVFVLAFDNTNNGDGKSRYNQVQCINRWQKLL